MSRPAQPEETQAQPTSSTHAGETQAGGNVSSWHEKLQDLPEVRPEMVIKGKQLLQQSEYPDRSQIENLASRLLGER